MGITCELGVTCDSSSRAAAMTSSIWDAVDPSAGVGTAAQRAFWPASQNSRLADRSLRRAWRLSPYLLLRKIGAITASITSCVRHKRPGDRVKKRNPDSLGRPDAWIYSSIALDLLWIYNGSTMDLLCSDLLLNKLFQLGTPEVAHQRRADHAGLDYPYAAAFERGQRLRYLLPLRPSPRCTVLVPAIFAP